MTMTRVDGRAMPSARVGEGQMRLERLPRQQPRRNEAVEIEEKRFGYFPKRFRWHGRSYSVQAVERCWTKSRGRAALCFRVRCAEGVFDLAQDVKANVWQLALVT